MAEVKIEGSILRAAKHFCGKKDIREYVNGISLNAEKNRIDMTDGHIALTIPFEFPEDFKSCVINQPALTPAAWEMCTLTQEGDDMHLDTNKGRCVISCPERFFPSDTRQTYPAIERIIPAEEVSLAEPVIFGNDILSLALKAFAKYDTFTLIGASDPRSPFVFRVHSGSALNNARMLIMPRGEHRKSHNQGNKS